MLPNFHLPLALAGEPRVFVARDVTVAEFFHGFPNSAPMMPCYDKETRAAQLGITTAIEAWGDVLLTRAIVKPKLDLDLIPRLGAGREQILLGYLRTVGWLVEEEAKDKPVGTLPPEDETIRRIEATWIASLPVFTTIPVENIKAALKLVSSKCRVPPHVVWMGWHISEFIFDWRILLQDGLLKRLAESDEGQAMLDAGGGAEEVDEE